MKRNLRQVAGRRLEELTKLHGHIRQNALAERLGVDQRSVRDWYKSAPLERIRQVSQALGIDYAYFEDSDKKVEKRGLGYYLSKPQARKRGKKLVSFEGSNSLSIARFIAANQGKLRQVDVRIETYSDNGVYLARGADLSAYVDGYQRTVTHHGPDATRFLGGSNAYFEDFQLKSISFINLSDERLLIDRASTVPVLSDAEVYEEGAALSEKLLSWGMEKEALHYLPRNPNSATCAILLFILENSVNDFAVMAQAFDALKSFWHHFTANTRDARKAYTSAASFIKQYFNEGEAKNAVLYAIEALPYCVHNDGEYQRHMRKLVDNLMSRRRRFHGASGEIAFTARVAEEFLPFVSAPSAYRFPEGDEAA